MQPLGRLFNELSGMAAGLALLTGLAHLALKDRDGLEPNVRELLDDALRDAAGGGAQAWARIDRAR